MLFATLVKERYEQGRETNLEFVLQDFVVKLTRYSQVLKEMFPHELVPDELRVSGGMEYEVTSSLTEAYGERVGSRYEDDLETLMGFADMRM